MHKLSRRLIEGADEEMINLLAEEAPQNPQYDQLQPLHRQQLENGNPLQKRFALHRLSQLRPPSSPEPDRKVKQTVKLKVESTPERRRRHKSVRLSGPREAEELTAANVQRFRDMVFMRGSRFVGRLPEEDIDFLQIDPESASANTESENASLRLLPIEGNVSKFWLKNVVRVCNDLKVITDHEFEAQRRHRQETNRSDRADRNRGTFKGTNAAPSKNGGHGTSKEAQRRHRKRARRAG